MLVFSLHILLTMHGHRNLRLTKCFYSSHRCSYKPLPPGCTVLVSIVWKLLLVPKRPFILSNKYNEWQLLSFALLRSIPLRRLILPALVSCDRASWAKCEERENQQDAAIRCLLSTSVSTCFVHHYAHLQENKDPCVTAYGVLSWFCWMWLVAVVGRCVVGCEQCRIW